MSDFDPVDWRPLIGRLSRRLADEFGRDPVRDAEDLESEMLLSLYEKRSYLERVNRFARAPIIEDFLIRAGEAYIARERWNDAPDMESWPVKTVRNVLPEIVRRREDWPGTAAEEAWDEMDPLHREAFVRRAYDGLPTVFELLPPRTYYDAVNRYAGKLNASLRRRRRMPGER